MCRRRREDNENEKVREELQLEDEMQKAADITRKFKKYKRHRDKLMKEKTVKQKLHFLPDDPCSCDLA